MYQSSNFLYIAVMIGNTINILIYLKKNIYFQKIYIIIYFRFFISDEFILKYHVYRVVITAKDITIYLKSHRRKCV